MRSLFLFFLISNLAWSWDSNIPVPDLSSPVVDNANLLSSLELGDVQRYVEEINKSGKVQEAVLIVDSLKGNDIESFSIAVAEKWKLGKAKKDNGLLFIIAPKERKMRFEVGYGLEGDLTDAMSKRILSDVVAVSFRKAHYADGIKAGLYHVAKILQVDQNLSTNESNGLDFIFDRHPIFLLVLIIILWSFISTVLAMSGLNRNRRYYGGGWHYGGRSGWGGGSSGSWGGRSGGGFSGGGGGFGGGGSSANW